MRKPLGIWASSVCIVLAFSANAAFAQTPAPTAAPAATAPSAPPTLANAAPAPTHSATLPPTAPAPPVYAPVTAGGEAAVAEPMPARVGFQMAFRTGYALPMGKVDDEPDGEMSNFYSGQVPIFIEVGGKPSPYIFLGGYFGLGSAGILALSVGRLLRRYPP